ncbi:sigma-70 family RNA polymerase sigma factor [bacterium]|nr:sigma-70 family RNA polymerase sigma factor [bacterium]
MDNFEKKTDQDLVLMALENKDNFLYIVNKYQEALKRYIRRLSNFNNQDVEDVLQNVFIKTYKNLNAYNSSLKFSSWLYRICHNETMDELRKRKVKATEYIDPQDFSQIKSSLDIKEEIISGIDIELGKELINKLKPKYRDVLILRILEEKDYKEISDILKKPVGTVSTLINRAKEHLNKEIIKSKYE